MTSQLAFDTFEEENSKAPDTFVGNMKLPVHRWFRYSAGFSGEWVEQVIKSHKNPIVLDPFAGSATTLVSAEARGVPSFGIESHPFVYRMAKAKLRYRSDPAKFEELCARVSKRAQSLKGGTGQYPELIRKCFSPECLQQLDALKRSLSVEDEQSTDAQLCWLVLCSILRKVSHAGTAPWQYVLPNRKKKGNTDAYSTFDATTKLFANDMRELAWVAGPEAELLKSDARTCEGLPDASVNLVITSPPYANNYDYADATRLELCFFGEVKGWADLQPMIRKHLVRACSQHVTSETVRLEQVLSHPLLKCIKKELETACNRLGEVRLQHGGKKNYHLMAACYFQDLAHVWKSLRRVCQTGSTVYFVIGDSAPYGVYLAVIDWFKALALDVGFKTAEFEKFRDRNVKWKNRKHRVPLCEGTLIVKG